MEYTATGVLTADQTEDFIQQCQNQYISSGFSYWTIELKATQQLVGLCGLNQHPIDGIEYLHLNYRLSSLHLGKGYASEAVDGIKRYCRDARQQKCLSAIIAPTNQGSITVIKRNEFDWHKRTKFKGMEVDIYCCELND